MTILAECLNIFLNANHLQFTFLCSAFKQIIIDSRYHKLNGNRQELRHVKSQRWSNIRYLQALYKLMFMMEEVRDTNAILHSLKHLRNTSTHLL